MSERLSQLLEVAEQCHERGMLNEAAGVLAAAVPHLTLRVHLERARALALRLRGQPAAVAAGLVLLLA